MIWPRGAMGGGFCCESYSDRKDCKRDYADIYGPQITMKLLSDFDELEEPSALSRMDKWD